MRRRFTGRPFRIISLLAMLVAGFAAGAGYIAIAATTGDTYNACLTSTGNIYRVRVNAKHPCIGTDKSITWNQQGQPGPVGPAGPRGLQGVEGEPGHDAADLPLICPGCDFFSDDEVLRTLGDLSGALLTGADLSDTDLDGLNLTGATLNGANLSGAALHQTNLTDARMHGANLTSAHAQDAVFEGVTMSSVKFNNADLLDAQGIPSDLTGADWDNTTCPDGTNSDTNVDDTCEGHFLALP